MNELEKIYVEVAGGNPCALSFLVLWHSYCHGVDDVVDGAIPAKDSVQVFGKTIEVYTHPFFVANMPALKMVAGLTTNTYEDSIAWEKDANLGNRMQADVMRFCGNEMIYAVALIVGGPDHLRKFSKRIRECSWNTHHDDNGNPK